MQVLLPNWHPDSPFEKVLASAGTLLFIYRLRHGVVQTMQVSKTPNQSLTICKSHKFCLQKRQNKQYCSLPIAAASVRVTHSNNELLQDAFLLRCDHNMLLTFLNFFLLTSCELIFMRWDGWWHASTDLYSVPAPPASLDLQVLLAYFFSRSF